MSIALYREEIGRNLKRARCRIGLKQVEVAVVANVGYRHYQKLEAGRVNVTIETLCRLARAFKTKVSKLVRGRY
jgi:transcriptional regulator with XRE-family HTH domain